MATSHTSRHPLRQMYLAGFFFAMHIALAAYVNSSFLGEYLSEGTVGILYIVGSAIGLIALLNIPKIIKKRGNYATISVLLLFNIITLITLATSVSVPVLIGAFILYLVLGILIIFEMDVFIEGFSKDETTGGIRGIFLTVINIAWLIAPLLAGYITDLTGSFRIIYGIGGILTFFVFLVFFASFRKCRFHQKSEAFSVRETFKKVMRRKNLWRIFKLSALLQFFYSVMVIYTPIYMHQHIGFSWTEIGFMLTIMHIPFILLEYPIGWLADKKWGEKEMMSIGLIIMGIVTIVYVIPTVPNLILWTTIFVLSRIGASFVEETTESYFFKQIEEEDTDLISFQRNARSVAYILGPAIVSLFLIFFELRWIYILLAIILFTGLFWSLKLKDTK